MTAVLLLSAAAVPLMSSDAQGAITCANAAGAVTVSVGAGSPELTMSRGAANSVVFTDDQAMAAVPCPGGPTVTNIDSVAINDTAAGQSMTVNVELEGGYFAPGDSPESTLPASEIEITVSGGDGSDFLNLLPRADPFNDTFNLGALFGGASGINTNPALEASFPDGDDIRLVGMEQANVFGEVFAFDAPPDGSNTIDASGTSEFSGPFPLFHNSFGGNATDVLRAGSNGSALNGALGTDTLAGGTGSDFLAPGAGDDAVTGAAGEDRVAYTAAPGPVTVDLRITGPQDTGSAGTDTINGVENLSGASGEDDTLIGDAGPNRLGGGEVPSETVGDDLLIGLGGDDEYRGGAGSDAISYEDASGPVTLELGVTTPQVTGSAGTDTVPVGDVESILGGPFGDTLTGTAGSNYLKGGAGRDTIKALAGPDVVDAGPDSEPDLADCGADVDTATADSPIDLLIDCETVTLFEVPSIPGPPDPPAVDSTPPQTRITKVARRGRRVVLRFSSTEAGSSYECKLDRRPFRPCSSPRIYRKLGFKRHAFRVRATDSAGNTDASPALRRLRVRRPA